MSPVTVITGAGGGIGAATARVLGSSGHAVALTDVDETMLTATAAQLTSGGGKVLPVVVDSTDAHSVETGLDEIETELGPVDHLVTAAGIIHKAPFLQLDEEAWDRTLAVNLKGTWLPIQRAARRMVAAGRQGSMVAISSVAGRGPRATAADYAASKAAVISVVRSAAAALGEHGIRVNAVCPGVVDTPMTSAIHEETARELGITIEESVARMVAAVPLGRIETPEEVADAVAFLLSDASRYVTGQALNVCGGLEFD